MGRMKSSQREKFEEETFPHIDALWRTASSLTEQRSSAEDLVLKTMERAYRSWYGPVDTAGNKARLFRILSGEFFGNGYGRHQSDRFLPECGETAVNVGVVVMQYTAASIDHKELPRLIETADVSVKDVIARLRPQSRLIMMLLLREKFSYVDIAYITDLREDSVKAIVSKLRRLIPRYLVQHEDGTVTTSPSPSAEQVQVPSFDDSQYSDPLPAAAILLSENSPDRGPQIGDGQTQNTSESEPH